MSAPSANDLYRAAQRFVRSGQPVFPCKSQGEKAKAPLTRHGVKDATIDLAQVRAWWKTHRDAAIGIPTGIVWDVLDVDVKRDEDGRVHLPRLNALGLLDGCQRVVRTPSGGWHLYFKATPGITNKARPGMGLDVRGFGGYVLADPSYLVTPDYEGSYEFVGEPTDPTNEPLMWDLIQSCLAPVDMNTKKEIPLLASERQRSVAALREWLSMRGQGERNTALHWAACRCVENGIDPHELVEVALHIGLGEEETLKTINSTLLRAGVLAEDLDSEAEALFPAIV